MSTRFAPLSRAVVLALLGAVASCGPGESDQHYGEVDRESRARDLQELADVQRPERWRAQFARWAEFKKQRRERIEADEQAEVARIKGRIAELRDLQRDVLRLRKRGSSGQLPSSVDVRGGRVFVRVTNTTGHDVSVRVGRLSKGPGYCPMHAASAPSSDQNAFPIAAGASVKFLHSGLSGDCPPVMSENDPILLEIREGATLRWASPLMLDRLADESKWELEKLEQPRPPPSKLGPWLREWPQ